MTPECKEAEPIDAEDELELREMGIPEWQFANTGDLIMYDFLMPQNTYEFTAE